MRTIGIGLHFEDLPVGERFRTCGRTITEADLVAFVGFSWLTEEVFTNLSRREGMALPAHVVPGAMVYAIAEGLLTPAMQGTGLAFLHAELDVRAPACVGDTLHVEVEVIESRPASRGGRGLVRTENLVRNQRAETVLIYKPMRLLRRRGVGPMPPDMEA